MVEPCVEVQLALFPKFLDIHPEVVVALVCGQIVICASRFWHDVPSSRSPAANLFLSKYTPTSPCQEY